MQTTLKLYAYKYDELKTYLLACLFIIGNIAFPQACHAFHIGGPTCLPIYFFTLIGAYKYGWRVGLLTAVVSPLVNSFFFGMPLLASLPSILIKSVLLAVASGVAAVHFHRASLLMLTGVVLFYQIFGSLGEWAIVGDFVDAMQDFRIGVPGMLVQIFGGYVTINYLIRK